MQTVDYVRQREGEFYVGDTRVTLRSIIADFPGVPLAVAYGAIAHYLERQPEFDAHFRDEDADVARARQDLEAIRPAFFADMRVRIAQLRPAILAELRDQNIVVETPELPRTSDNR